MFVDVIEMPFALRGGKGINAYLYLPADYTEEDLKRIISCLQAHLPVPPAREIAETQIGPTAPALEFCSPIDKQA